MTIKNRIIYSSFLMLSLFILMGVVNWFGNKSVMNKTNIAYMLEHENMHLQGLFRGLNEFIIDEGEPLSIELTKSHLTGFEEIYKELKKETEKNDLNKLIEEKIKPLWKSTKTGAIAFMDNNPYISVDDDNAMLEYGRLTTEAKTLLEVVSSLADETLLDAESTRIKFQNVTYIVGSIIFLLISYILFNLYRSITSPIKELRILAEGFANGDLSILINDSRKDEFGELGSHFNKATAKLNEMIFNVIKVIRTLNSNSETLSETARKIVSNSHEQFDQTTQTVSAMEELSSSHSDVAQNTVDVAASAKEVNELAFKSADVISGTVNSITNIAQSIKESSSNIEALGKGSEMIGDVVKVIDDIAGQTNLLALNAAIEAARAGEQGRGFSVVADEVRNLAEKTASSTKEIAEMIKGIQGNTSKTIESLDVWKKDVESSIELAGEAGNALQMIVVSVNDVTDRVQLIATAAEEQSNTGDSITSNVESVANISEQTAEAARESADSVNELNKLARQLQHLVDGFQLRGVNMEENETSIPEDINQEDINIVNSGSFR